MRAYLLRELELQKRIRTGRKVRFFQLPPAVRRAHVLPVLAHPKTQKNANAQSAPESECHVAHARLVADDAAITSRARVLDPTNAF